MNSLRDWIASETGQMPLLVGAAMLYIASRAAVDALAGKNASPGRRAFGHWIPIAAAAIAAVLCRRGDLALAIIFSTSVASLSLNLGAIILAEPYADAPAHWRRVWPFILPAVMLALLAGFAGRLNWIHALMLLIEGGVLLAAWLERASTDPQEGAATVDSTAAPISSSIGHLNLALAIGLAIVGAVAAMFGVTQLGRSMVTAPSTLVVVVALGPLLIVPMLVLAGGLARRGLAWAATTTAVGVVLLNLCLLLPVVVLLWYPVSAIHGDLHHPNTWGFNSLRDVTPLVYGLVTWRVDTVVLLLLGFILLPVSIGRWRLGRSEGMVLIGFYIVYILMETAASMQT